MELPAIHAVRSNQNALGSSAEWISGMGRIDQAANSPLASHSGTMSHARRRSRQRRTAKITELTPNRKSHNGSSAIGIHTSRRVRHSAATAIINAKPSDRLRDRVRNSNSTNSERLISTRSLRENGAANRMVNCAGMPTSSTVTGKAHNGSCRGAATVRRIQYHSGGWPS